MPVILLSKDYTLRQVILGSIVVSIPACHAGDRGSIPRRGVPLFSFFIFLFIL